MNNYKYLEEFLYRLQSVGRYAFTLEEIKSAFDASDRAINQALFRMKKKGTIAQIRKGFYVIITPEYSAGGMLPVTMFIDDLMKSLGRKYYLGLFTAAALHGAAHQQPMTSWVVTGKPALRSVVNKKLSIHFLVKKEWADDDIIDIKSSAGYIKVSSPGLTALDLLFYGSRLSMNSIFTVLQELTDEMKVSDLIRAAKNFPQTASLQRLGFLLDKIPGNKKRSEALFNLLKDKRPNMIPLVSSNEKKGEKNKKWKVIINFNVEGDL